jgi:polyhydroxyalkanoate synthesis regulator phasin
MENRSSNTLMLLTGIVAGAATVYYFSTPKGKKLLEVLTAKGEVLKEEIKQQAESLSEEIKSKEESLIEVGAELLNKAKASAAKVDDLVSESFEKTESKFNDGIEAAAKKLKRT